MTCHRKLDTSYYCATNLASSMSSFLEPQVITSCTDLSSYVTTGKQLPSKQSCFYFIFNGVVSSGRMQNIVNRHITAWHIQLHNRPLFVSVGRWALWTILKEPWVSLLWRDSRTFWSLPRLYFFICFKDEHVTQYVQTVNCFGVSFSKINCTLHLKHWIIDRHYCSSSCIEWLKFWGRAWW